MKSSDAISTLRAAQIATSRLKAAEEELSDRHAALVEERTSLFNASVCREEVLANVDALVERERKHWYEHHQSRWVRSISGTWQMRERGRNAANEPKFIEVRVPPRFPDFLGCPSAPGAMRFDDLCGIAPNLVKDGLRAMVSAAPDNLFGLPLSERASRLATLDSQIAEVEQEHAALVASAADVGITLRSLQPFKSA